MQKFHEGAVMEEYSTTVRMSGLVLSSLMFHHLNTDSDLEGMLLGESVGEEKSKITDSQTDHIQFVHTINVQKHVTCRGSHSFYNNTCAVDHKKIRHALSNLKEENVIGWYRQRRNTLQQMTFKEQLVHQNLRKLLPYQELVFLLLTTTEAPSGSTHRVEYTAFIWNGSQYSSVPVTVSNLGTLEQQDYWRVSSTCPSLSLCQTIKHHRGKFFSSDEDLWEVERVSSMNDALLEEMKSVCMEVEQSERRVEKLHAEISQLRETINQRRKNQRDSEAERSAGTGVSMVTGPQENVLLCAALRTLFPHSAAFRTQTLSGCGFPVLELCCSADHHIDIPTRLPALLNHQRSVRKRRMSRGARRKGRSPPTGTSVRRKRRSQADSGEAATDSGSDTEVEQSDHNTNASPVY